MTLKGPLTYEIWKKMDNAAFVAAENQLFGVCSSNRMSVAVKTVISVDYI